MSDSSSIVPTNELLEAAMANALGLAMYNAVLAQQQSMVVRQAATAMVCSAIVTQNATAGAVTKPPSTPAAPAPTTPPQAEEQVAKKGDPAAAAPKSLAAAIDAVGMPQADFNSINGKAYQFVALSVALAVQDAADYLRSVTTIAATASGVALANITSEDLLPEGELIGAGYTQAAVAAAILNLDMVGGAAANILERFPQYDAPPTGA
ncbi:RebB family R body protein [Sphingomonas sp. AOB5]|uniref:RebB family R body protein n=1 Tax=Sphingomonas sp. AOB5 TaxID=3034017 RepID=UPI0023F9B965|nr:RebB family R body protein [Sphingomonas sp. AOB5]MDF7774538.1 RebB family R body protein [Sphingomonas sp. AOB5]